MAGGADPLLVEAGASRVYLIELVCRKGHTLALLLPPSPFELLWLHLFRIDSKSLDALQAPSAIRTATPLITCKAFGCMIVLAITWQRTLGVHTVSFGTLGESDHYYQSSP